MNVLAPATSSLKVEVTCVGVRQRSHWNGPASLGSAWTMVKGPQTAVYELQSHQFGWELRLTIARDLVRSHVCRERTTCCAFKEEWRRARRLVCRYRSRRAAFAIPTLSEGQPYRTFGRPH